MQIAWTTPRAGAETGAGRVDGTLARGLRGAWPQMPARPFRGRTTGFKPAFLAMCLWRRRRQMLVHVLCVHSALFWLWALGFQQPGDEVKRLAGALWLVMALGAVGARIAEWNAGRIFASRTRTEPPM